MFDRVEIGKRIGKARDESGYKSREALALELSRRIASLPQEPDEKGNKEGRKPLSRQTVDNWENGKYVPPPPMIELMAQIFGPPYDEEWIMFGPRRNQQIAQDRSFVVRVTPEEAELLQTIRRANPAGQRSIMTTAKSLAEENPAEEATFHVLRRHSDTSPK